MAGIYSWQLTPTINSCSQIVYMKHVAYLHLKLAHNCTRRLNTILPSWYVGNNSTNFPVRFYVREQSSLTDYVKKQLMCSGIWTKDIEWDVLNSTSGMGLGGVHLHSLSQDVTCRKLTLTFKLHSNTRTTQPEHNNRHLNPHRVVRGIPYAQPEFSMVARCNLQPCLCCFAKQW